MCPAPGQTVSSVAGSAAAIDSAHGGGVSRSRSPTSAAAGRWARAARVSSRCWAPIEARNPPIERSEARATAEVTRRMSVGSQRSPKSIQRMLGRSARSSARGGRQDPQRASTPAPVVSASRISRAIRGESP